MVKKIKHQLNHHMSWLFAILIFLFFGSLAFLPLDYDINWIALIAIPLVLILGSLQHHYEHCVWPKRKSN